MKLFSSSMAWQPQHWRQFWIPPSKKSILRGPLGGYSPPNFGHADGHPFWKSTKSRHHPWIHLTQLLTLQNHAPVGADPGTLGSWIELHIVAHCYTCVPFFGVSPDKFSTKRIFNIEILAAISDRAVPLVIFLGIPTNYYVKKTDEWKMIPTILDSFQNNFVGLEFGDVRIIDITTIWRQVSQYNRQTHN